MGFLNSVDQNGLNLIARMARGSGRFEGTDGGRGNMGVVRWGDGRVRVIKFDTHLFGKKTGADAEKAKASDELRRQLLQFAGNAEVEKEELKEIRRLLGLSKDGDGWEAKSLLDRKTVAKVLVKIDKDIWTHALEGADVDEYSTDDQKTDFDSVKDMGSHANHFLRHDTLPQGTAQTKDVQYLPKTPLEKAKPEWRPAIMVLDKMAGDMLSLYAGQIPDEQATLFRQGIERYMDEIEDHLDDSLSGALNEKKMNRLQETFRPLVNDLAICLRPHMNKMSVIRRLSQEVKADPNDPSVSRMPSDVEDIFNLKVGQYRLEVAFLPADQVTEEAARGRIEEFAKEAETEANENRLKTIHGVIDDQIERIDDLVRVTFVQLDMRYPEEKVANFHKSIDGAVRKLAQDMVTDDESTRAELRKMVESRARDYFPKLSIESTRS